MGIILTDVYTLNNGIELSNVYISFFEEQLFIQPRNLPDGNKFIVSACYRLYKDKTAREEIKEAVEKSTIMNMADNLAVVYDQLYVALKQKFPSSVDDI